MASHRLCDHTPLWYIGARRSDRNGGDCLSASAGCVPVMRIPHGLFENTGAFWKKEDTGDGEKWVGARASDDVAADRWTENVE